MMAMMERVTSVKEKKYVVFRASADRRRPWQTFEIVQWNRNFFFSNHIFKIIFFFKLVESKFH